MYFLPPYFHGFLGGGVRKTDMCHVVLNLYTDEWTAIGKNGTIEKKRGVCYNIMTYVSRFSALCRMKIRALHKDAKMYGVCRDVLLKLLGITGYIEVAFEMLAESIWQKAGVALAA